MQFAKNTSPQTCNKDASVEASARVNKNNKCSSPARLDTFLSMVVIGTYILMYKSHGVYLPFCK